MQLRGIFPGAGVLLAATALFFAADNPKLPAPYATPSANNGPRVIPKPADARLNVPAASKPKYGLTMGTSARAS